MTICLCWVTYLYAFISRVCETYFGAGIVSAEKIKILIKIACWNNYFVAAERILLINHGKYGEFQQLMWLRAQNFPLVVSFKCVEAIEVTLLNSLWDSSVASRQHVFDSEEHSVDKISERQMEKLREVQLVINFGMKPSLLISIFLFIEAVALSLLNDHACTMDFCEVSFITKSINKIIFRKWGNKSINVYQNRITETRVAAKQSTQLVGLRTRHTTEYYSRPQRHAVAVRLV